MKIIISPSKTKKLVLTAECEIFNPEITASIVSQMQSLSVAQLAKALKVKTDKAEQLVAFWHNYGNQSYGEAAASYSGLAYKRLAWSTLDLKAQKFGNEHLIILSGLYGIVKPLSPITDYRLDFVDNIFPESKQKLTTMWQEAINKYLDQEDYLLNLASAEYSSILTHPRMVTIEFLECKKDRWQQFSTSAKQCRGLLAHYLLANQITSVAELPKQIGEFSLVSELPTEVTASLTIEYHKLAK